MLTKEELQKLGDESVETLSGRVQLASLLMLGLAGDDSPEAEEARENLRTQQEQINALIAQKTKDTKPESTVVEMQPATFAALFVRPN